MSWENSVVVVQERVLENGLFPNNPRLPFLLYKKCLKETQVKSIEEIFLSNGWKNTWIDSIYPFHHYHSNTHEALGVSSGECTVQIGGEGGKAFYIEKGDVLLIPAGVSHKNLSSSLDFLTVGAYPFAIAYDMCYGKEEELSSAKSRIPQVPLPKSDPVFGENGPLLELWKA